MKNLIINLIAFLLYVNINLFSQEYELVWSDEFEGDNLDPYKWGNT